MAAKVAFIDQVIQLIDLGVQMLNTLLPVLIIHRKQTVDMDYSQL